MNYTNIYSEILVLMKQSKMYAKALQSSVLNLTDDQINTLITSKTGDGILVYGNKIVPFTNEMDKVIKPIKILSKINIKGKIVKGITFLFFRGAIIFLVLIVGATISDTNLSLIKPRLSEDQVEDIKAKIEYLDILTKRKIVTYENEMLESVTGHM